MSIAFFLMGTVFAGITKAYIYCISKRESYLAKKCGRGILERYPLAELFSGFLFLQIYRKFGLTPDCLPAVILICCITVCTMFDLKYQIIPDTVVLPVLIIGFVINILLRRQGLADYLLGFAFAGGINLLIAIASKGGMGLGDVKLFAAVGMFLGFRLAILSMILAFIFGSIVGILLVVLDFKKLKDPIPFGPFIALGSAVSLFLGDEIIRWYLKSFFL